VSAASSLGIPHPSGFPGYILFAKALSWFPFGPISFRVQLLSIITGALLVGITLRILDRLSPSRAVVWAAAVPTVFALMSAHLFILHSTTPEVYTPTALFLAAVVGASVYPGTEINRRFIWMGLWTGMGLTFHFSAFLVSVLPVWGWMLFASRGLQGNRETVLGMLKGTGVALIPFLAYGYIPLATAHDPWRNWGNPDSLLGLWDHLTASSIRAAFTGDMLSTSPMRIWTFLQHHMGALWESVGLLVVFAPLGAILAILRRHPTRPLSALLLSILLVDGIFSVFINPMGIEDRQTGLHSVWALTALSGLLVLTIHHEKWTRGKMLSLPVLGLVLSALSSPLLQVAQDRTFNRSDINFPERYQTRILRHAPPNALLLTGSDDSLGTLNQSLGVDNSRPDLALIALPHIYAVDELEHWQRLYGDSIIDPERLQASQAQASSQGWLSSADQMEWLKAWVEHADVPVLWGVGEQKFDSLTSNFIRWGFPFSLIQKEESPESPSGRHDEINRVISNWAWRAGQPLDVISAQSMSEQARLAGRQALTARHTEAAEQLFTLSLDLFPESHRTWSDLGVLRFGKGDIKGAASAAKLAIQFRPDLPNPRFRLIEALHTLGEHMAVIDAVSSMEYLGVQGMKLRRARILGAQSHVKLGQVDEALILLSHNLVENPKDAESLSMVKTLRP